MIAAESRLLTYQEAADKIGGVGIRFIRERIRAGTLKGTDLGHHCKRVSELALLKYLEESGTYERRRK